MMRRIIALCLLFLALLLTIAIFYFFGIDQLLTLEALKANRFQLQLFVQDHYLIAVTFYIALYAILSAIAMPAMALLTVAGGFLFDVVPATLYVVIGGTIGATIAFLLARYFFSQTVRNLYSKKIRYLDEAVAKQGKYYVLLVRFIPFLPFSLINIIAGLSSIPVVTFIASTAIGILPVTFVYAYAGKKLAAIHTLRDIFTWPVLSIFLLLSLLALMPLILMTTNNHKR